MPLFLSLPFARIIPRRASQLGNRWAVAALLLACVAGCEPPRPSPEDLGRVVVEPAKVPGGQKPFTLPELKSEPPGEGKSPPGARGDNHQGHDH